jgi:hypothetical protein
MTLAKPPGGTPTLMRTGNRCSAETTISRGLPWHLRFSICSWREWLRCLAMSSRLGYYATKGILGLRAVTWPDFLAARGRGAERGSYARLRFDSEFHRSSAMRAGWTR